METLNIFSRNIKWRFQNPVTIIMTIIQPLIWLLFYSNMAADISSSFILPGIIVLVMFSSAGNNGVANYYSKQNGSFYRIHISPVKKSSVVLGHVLDAEVFSFTEVLILILISFFMSVRISFSELFLMLPVIFATVFFISSFSYFLSLIIPSENVFYIFLNTFILPLFFMSTALFPYEKIPVQYKTAVNINPFTHVINSLRTIIMNQNNNYSEYLFSLMLMILLGVIMFIISVKKLKIYGKNL